MSKLKEVSYHGSGGKVEVVEKYRDGVCIERTINGLIVPVDQTIKLLNFNSVTVTEQMTLKEFKRTFG